jgi:hypothetical protein
MDLRNTSVLTPMVFEIPTPPHPHPLSTRSG